MRTRLREVTEYQVLQADIEELLAIEARAKELRFAMRAALEATGEAGVEPGLLEAKLIDVQRVTPDYRGYILRHYGRRTVNRIKAATKPTHHKRLLIGARVSALQEV